MKLQIDTEAKTIKVEENVKFDELVKALNKLLPKEWKQYTLETSGVWYWYDPIVIPHSQPIYPLRWDGTCGATGEMINGSITTSYVYNVEIQN